jgi:hypothetical protein
MTETRLNPPRVAHALLQVLVRPSDAESIPGDLLEEYREVRRPSMGRLRADVWYAKHVLSVLWRLMWPSAVAITVLRIASFPLPGGPNPSLVPAPGVSLIDAFILVWAGYRGSQRTGRINTGLIIAVATSVVGYTTFVAYALAVDPTLIRAPFKKPFIFAILSIVALMALGFGLAAGTAGAAAGRLVRSTRPKARLT